MEVFRTYTQMSEWTRIVTGCLAIIAIGVTLAFFIDRITEENKIPFYLGIVCMVTAWFMFAAVCVEGKRDTFVIADAATIDWGTVTRHYRPTEINDRLVTLKVLEAEE